MAVNNNNAGISGPRVTLSADKMGVPLVLSVAEKNAFNQTSKAAESSSAFGQNAFDKPSAFATPNKAQTPSS